VDQRDCRFVSWLGIAFGPLFVVGGFMAAFTTIGAIYVWFGLALFEAGLLLRAPVPLWLPFAAAGVSFVALTVGTMLEYS
jgi:hypothetical protein